MANSGIPIGKWSGSDATEALHDAIDQYAAASEKQTKTMLRLTWAIVVLTLMLFAGLCVQIWVQVTDYSAKPVQVGVSSVPIADTSGETEP